ncbi:hypothetical protein HDU96_005665 [Phlyctochytrium bullatum]|nr:hypothetical protein HDU96_005665 [Phlyctochytrium bullatum]
MGFTTKKRSQTVTSESSTADSITTTTAATPTPVPTNPHLASEILLASVTPLAAFHTACLVLIAPQAAPAAAASSDRAKPHDEAIAGLRKALEVLHATLSIHATTPTAAAVAPGTPTTAGEKPVAPVVSVTATVDAKFAVQLRALLEALAEMQAWLEKLVKAGALKRMVGRKACRKKALAFLVKVTGLHQGLVTELALQNQQLLR